MVGSNKILTVSYGTFSCTLEGFDDSFHSMKAIAEYFRDLAQEDRYFGAEPPTPDAEMLAKIAEREISRRVEADIDDRGIRLRATAPQVAGPATTEAAMAEEDEGPGPVAASQPAAAAPAADPVAMPPEVEAPAASPSIASAFTDITTTSAPAAPDTPAPTAVPGSFAAKLQRIRSVVNNPLPPEAATDDAEDFESAPPMDVDAADDDKVMTDYVAEAEFAEDVLSQDPEDVVAAETDADTDLAEDISSDTADEAKDQASAEDAYEDEDENALSSILEATAEPETAEQTPEADIADDIDALATEDTSEMDEVEVEAADDLTSDAPTTDDSEDAADAPTLGTEGYAAWAASTLAETAGADADILHDDADDAAELEAEAEAEAEEDANADAVAEDAETAEEVAAAEDAAAEVSDEDDAAAAEVAAEPAEDLSFDLNDNDLDEPGTLVADKPQSTRPISKARIVRIRKDNVAMSEVIPVETADVPEENAVSALVGEGFMESAPIETDMAEDDGDTGADTSFDDDTGVMDAVSDALASDTEETEETEAVAEDEAEKTGHDTILAAIAAAMPAGTLSDEDEDDLQRELAAVSEEVVSLDEDDDEPQQVVINTSEDDALEAEAVTSQSETEVDVEAEVEVEAEADVAAKIEADAAVDAAVDTDADADADANADIETDTPEVVQSQPKARKRLPTEDYAVTRMIAQTDEALNEPAGSRRRNAIAQLKAAVAATEAARQLGDDANSGDESKNAFREDLDEVVRSSSPIETSRPIETSKPVEAEDTPERPRASPLKLVASQRVDDSEEAAPVSRPVSGTVDAGEAGSFAQFAASMGATELPDLLEAAAAYTSFVEGVEDFSRPQIMKKVQMTTSEEFSREDGLRSFGTLLRQGRISKVRNGRFQVSEQTRFRPDARSA